jgi:hypothetical protein
MSHITGAVVQTPLTLNKNTLIFMSIPTDFYKNKRKLFTITQPILTDKSKRSRLGVKEKLGSSYYFSVEMYFL